MAVIPLDDRTIRSLRPPASGRFEVRDSKVRGLVLRVTPAGVKTFSVVYRTKVGQVARRYLLGTFKAEDTRGAGITLASARREAEAILREVAGGGDPQGALVHARRAAAESAAAPGPLDVSALVRKCLERLPLRPKTVREWRRLADVEIVPALGARPAAELTRAEIREWARVIAERPAPYTSNRAFEVLRRVYSWGVEQDLLTGTPFIKLPKPATEERSERVLTTDELRAVLLALDVVRQKRPIPEAESGAKRPKKARKTLAGWPAYCDAVELLILTGVRRDMVVGMRRQEIEDLDGTDPRWLVPGGFAGRSKSGKAHLVPLSGAALDVVWRRLAAVKGECLFPVARRGKLQLLTGAGRPDVPMTWSSRFVDALQAEALRILQSEDREAGGDGSVPFPRWTIHGLRHTVATHMREDLKTPREVVSLILGHTQGGPTATRIYDRAELLPERRSALGAWASWVRSLKRRESARRASVVTFAR